MIIHQDCYNRNYTVNFYNDNIEIIINFVPKDNYNQDKLYFDLIVYFMINNTIIKYKDKIFHKEEELKNFSNVLDKFLFTTKYTSKFTQITKY